MKLVKYKFEKLSLYPMSIHQGCGQCRHKIRNRFSFEVIDLIHKKVSSKIRTPVHGCILIQLRTTINETSP